MKKYFIPVVIAAVATGLAGFRLFAHAQVGMTLPSVPTGVAATVSPPSRVSVSWTAATESSGTIEGYYVYRNGGQIATTAGTSLIDSGIGSGIYFYTVAAYDANGNVSARSSAASVTVIADTTPPSTPVVTVSGTTSTNSSSGQVTLTVSWSVSTDDVGVAGYYVYRNGMQIVSNASAFTGTSITDTVTPGTYTYAVAAYDAAQNFSNRSAAVVTVSVDAAAPSVPANIAIQQVSATGANVSWATSTDDVGVAGYQIFRNNIQIASAGGPPYADTGLSSGAAYTYAVAAYDAAGNVSSRSLAAALTVQLTGAPTIPYILAATFLGTSTVKIWWTPAGDVLAIAGYTVYRNGAAIISSVASTTYFDAGLASGTYAYSVSATDIAGLVSGTSSPMSVIVPVIPSVPAPSVAATTSPAAASSPVVPSASSSGTLSAPPMAANQSFTQFLYFGLRSAEVQSLQSLLASNGYLLSANATGFFGSLTLAALRQFQCDRNIVCTGGAGWGTAGPKTRNVLNNIQGSANSSASSSFSVSALTAEIQNLQAKLTDLERQLKSQNP